MRLFQLFLVALFSFFLACTTPDAKLAVEETDLTADTTQYNIPEGFELEELYRPSTHDQGTWVSLAEGQNGLFYACDQRGDIYQFKMPGPGEVLDSINVDSVDLNIGYAHGMLWAFNSLYVAVNRKWPDEDDVQIEGEELLEDINGSGVYRLTDTDGDNRLDNMEMLLGLEGHGEHGPHNLVLSPDGAALYFIAGNHTLVPEMLAQNSRVPNVWGEDNLMPSYPDARGHATDIEAPGGWIAKFDPEGKNWELVSTGFRNAFDIAFNPDGELFAFDADMEWDFGMPWYRPIRICHVTSGSSFGWRTGSGKWPVYYPDNLPPVVNLGQGSPTMLVSGAGLTFPAKYKNGLLAFDWSFGTVYFVDLEASGSTYTGKKEEFFSGIPLPLTSAVAGSDGHLYFATGGRDLESRLYRLRYAGSDIGEIKQSDNNEQQALRTLRHSLEAFHNIQSTEAVPLAWEHLNHPDRFIRFAARVALEHQPLSSWENRLTVATDPDQIIQATIAMARHAKPNRQKGLIDKLGELKLGELSKSKKLDLLRAYSLIFIRMGKPNAAQRAQCIQVWNAHFPSGDYEVDREISQLLVYLEDEAATAKCIQLLEKHTEEKTGNHPELLSEEVAARSDQYGPQIQEMLQKMPATEATFYGTLLSHATAGWTDELRAQYFQWFFSILDSKGGMSYKAFLENIRLQAMTHVPEDKKDYYEELSGIYSPMDDMANLPQPKGPGKVYNAIDVYQILGANLNDNYLGDISRGKLVYEAALCGTCHRMQGEGGSIGPDMTQLYTRFKRNEMVDAIFSPNDVISDQYAFTLFHMKDGKKMAGRILSEKADKITIMQNPYSTTFTVELANADVLKRELSPVSPMPPGLLNRLNEEEIVDLFVYLLSGGDKEHFYYGGEKGREKEELE